MISTVINRVVYDCDNSTTTFDFPYKLFANTDLKVYLVDETSWSVTLLTITTHYTVTPINSDYKNGCTVTTVATYGTDKKLVLIRDMDATQSSDFVHNDPLPSETLENALDRLSMLIQQLEEISVRAVQAPVHESGVNVILPSVTDRKGKYLYFNATTGAVEAKT